jgi:hypothetical protein
MVSATAVLLFRGKRAEGYLKETFKFNHRCGCKQLSAALAQY